MEEDLRSSGAGLRGFKSHPRHHSENTGAQPWRALTVFYKKREVSPASIPIF